MRTARAQPRAVTAAAIPFLLFLALLCVTRPASGEPAPSDVADAAGVARRAALDLLRSPSPRVFAESLDADGILARRLGGRAWEGLTGRQKEQLRAGVRERFVRTLSPPHSGTGEIAWSGAQASGTGVDALLGLRFDSRVLKTRWVMKRVGTAWKVADVVLSDPGVSLARAAERALGAKPLDRRAPGQDVWSNAFPRLAAIAILIALAGVIALRLPRAKRPLLYLTVAAPVSLFAIDGALAVHRAISEPYVVRSPDAPGERWHAFEQLALAAERDGRTEAAREYWRRALESGAPAGPVEYQLGLAARQNGETDLARTELERALAETPPAPGARRELAEIDVPAGRYEAAEERLTRYLVDTGPDPESLSLLSVIQTNLGKNAEAVESLNRARALVGEGWKGEAMDARVRARAGDAEGCVAALKELERRGLATLDRSALRSDPAYLPIATDPAWVAFLNERLPPARKPAAAPGPRS